MRLRSKHTYAHVYVSGFPLSNVIFERALGFSRGPTKSVGSSSSGIAKADEKLKLVKGESATTTPPYARAASDRPPERRWLLIHRVLIPSREPFFTGEWEKDRSNERTNPPNQRRPGRKEGRGAQVSRPIDVHITLLYCCLYVVLDPELTFIKLHTAASMLLPPRSPHKCAWGDSVCFAHNRVTIGRPYLAFFIYCLPAVHCTEDQAQAQALASNCFLWPRIRNAERCTYYTFTYTKHANSQTQFPFVNLVAHTHTRVHTVTVRVRHFIGILKMNGCCSRARGLGAYFAIFYRIVYLRPVLRRAHTHTGPYKPCGFQCFCVRRRRLSLRLKLMHHGASVVPYVRTGQESVSPFLQASLLFLSLSQGNRMG